MWRGELAMDDDLLFEAKLDEYRSICLSPLARETVEEAGANHLGDRGYFIYEVDDSPISNGISVIAKFASLDAAFRFIDLWRARASIPRAGAA
jgi:hypothetical protein